MAKKVRNLLICGMVAILMFGCVGVFGGCTDKNVKTYTVDDVKVGDTFEIVLESYGYCGESWELGKLKSGMEYVDYEFVPNNPNPDVFGSGGKCVNSFKATKSGRYTIRFERRSAMPENSLIETHIYKVNVVK